MVESRVGRGRRALALALLFAASAMLLAGVGQRPADADVTEITASAFGYYTNVGLFGGPQTVRGFGQTIPPGTLESESPSVDCPSTGTAVPMVDVDLDGAIARYGPASIFSGQWPEDASQPPPSGPINVTCAGTTGPGGSASSSADLINVGPGPFIADEVHSTCVATEGPDGEAVLTGTTTIIGGILETSYDPNTQLPDETEPIPVNPEPNYTREGTIDHVGDSYRIVFNEQIVNPDGTLTVNAAHMYLLGPIAIGDMVVGSSTCGLEAVVSTTTTTEATTTTTEATTTTTSSTSSTTSSTTSTTTPEPTTTTTSTPGNMPTNKDQCKNGGYAAFGFRNQGQCVSFVNQQNRG